MKCEKIIKDIIDNFIIQINNNKCYNDKLLKNIFNMKLKFYIVIKFCIFFFSSYILSINNLHKNIMHFRCHN